MTKYTAKTADKHELYELSVQCVDADIDFIIKTFQNIRKRKPQTIKEDFCGTAAAACEFVKRSPKNHAIGVDLHKPTLEYGREKHVKKLGRSASRVTLVNANVLDVRDPKVDAVLAMNFSYFIFKKREEMKKYYQSVYDSLNMEGLFFMDAYGGSEAQVPQKEKRKFKGFNYIWEQHSYNPINNGIINYIHFKFPDGTKLKKAFEYDWRLWSLREITELLEKVGFKKATIYWEGWDEEEEAGDGNFQPTLEAENCEGWIAYIVGEK